eukprot:10464069-Alexandrium_andersonii.AAC.1
MEGERVGGGVKAKSANRLCPGLGRKYVNVPNKQAAQAERDSAGAECDGADAEGKKRADETTGLNETSDWCG